VLLALSLVLLAARPAWAYVGPGPGMELVPQFFSLLTWAAVALGAVLLWPVTALIRWARGGPRPCEE
jgi:hypothetical protein